MDLGQVSLEGQKMGQVGFHTSIYKYKSRGYVMVVLPEKEN